MMDACRNCTASELHSEGVTGSRRIDVKRWSDAGGYGVTGKD